MVFSHIRATESFKSLYFTIKGVDTIEHLLRYEIQLIFQN